MFVSDEVLVFVLALVGIMAGIIGGIVVLYYYIRYIRANRKYLRTHDLETWNRDVRKLSNLTALVVFFISLIMTETCVFAFMLSFDVLNRNPVLPLVGILLGVVISLVLASNVIVHARWQDVVRYIVEALGGRQSHSKEFEPHNGQQET